MPDPVFIFAVTLYFLCISLEKRKVLQNFMPEIPHAPFPAHDGKWQKNDSHPPLYIGIIPIYFFNSTPFPVFHRSGFFPCMGQPHPHKPKKRKIIVYKGQKCAASFHYNY
jgi:hypothetical protein